MKYLVLILITFGVFAKPTVQELYLEALTYEEVDADFVKAKQLYSKIISEYVTEQKYVARAMYHIAFISEMYNQKSTAENYYKMILSKYSSVKGLKYLSQNGLNRLTNGTASCSPDKNDTTKSAVLNNNTTTSDTNSQTVKKEPFDNDKYRHGKTDPLYILSVGEEVNIEFDGIKGLGASDPDVAEIKPTTSNLKIIGKKVGFVEIMIKDNTGKENHINVNVVDSTSNKIDNIYMIKKESKKIYISNIEKIAADNDNIELSAKDKTVSIKAKKEGNITLTLMRKDGTKVDVTIKVLKPYEKKMAISLKSLETKDIKFDQISSISITTHGIVDVKQESKIIKITGTSKGKTFVIVYGKDNSQLKLDVTVE